MSPPPIGWSFGLCALALLPAAVAQAEPIRLVALNAPEAEAGIAPNASDLECLALNVYWEARSEPRLGQIAVAAVTLNRVADPAFPDTVCAVVRQGEERGRDRCQFSWHCDGLDDRPSNPSAWLNARQIARLALAGRLSDPTGGALWFHAEHVHPDWAGDMALVGQIGAHLFYRPPSALSRWNSASERPDATPVAAPPDTSAMSARLMVIQPAPDAPPPDAPQADPEALAAARQEPCGEPPADLMTTLAAASQADFLALVEALRRTSGHQPAAGGPPCARAEAGDGQALAFAPAVVPGRASFDAGYGPFPFEATLPGARVIADAQAPLAAPRPLGRSFSGSFVEPRRLGRSFGVVTGRGGALTRPDAAWASVVTVATAPSATASGKAATATASATPPPAIATASAQTQPARPAAHAMVASGTPGPERLALADNVSPSAEPAIQPLPAFAPVLLLRGLAPPALSPRAPASPF